MQIKKSYFLAYNWDSGDETISKHYTLSCILHYTIVFLALLNKKSILELIIHVYGQFCYFLSNETIIIVLPSAKAFYFILFVGCHLANCQLGFMSLSLQCHYD